MTLFLSGRRYSGSSQMFGEPSARGAELTMLFCRPRLYHPDVMSKSYLGMTPAVDKGASTT